MSNYLRESSELTKAAQEYIDAELSFNHVSLTYLSEKYGLKREKISKRIKEMGGTVVNRTNGFPIDYTVFDKIDTEEKAYWLGFLYADGCITKNDYVEVGVQENDKEHLEKYRAFLKLKNKEAVKCADNLARVRVHNSHLANALKSKGCIPVKSLILTFPDESIFENKNLIYDFLRGYCDGDGCLRFYMDKTVHMTTVTFVGTKSFLEGIVSFLGITGSLRNASCEKNKTEVYRLTFHSSKARMVARLLYENSTVYMDRKYALFQQFCRFEEEFSRTKSSKISRR